MLGGASTVSFKYDPFGRRIYKSSSSGTSIFAYDGNNLIEEVNSSGGVVARYAQTTNIDEPLAMSRAGATSYYDADGLGSITSLSNGAGSLAQTYTYDSFGKITASTGSLTNPFRYTGREFDTETNLYFYRARYYDPTTGRFLSEDPMEFAAGDVNLYRYAYNNAENRTDPTGFWPTGRDKWWGHNDRNFQWWWHNCWWKNEPYDGTKEDVETGWAEWISRGRPPVGRCWNNPEPEPAPCKKRIQVPDPKPVVYIVMIGLLWWWLTHFPVPE
jgi:RHS repeat-associated protein